MPIEITLSPEELEFYKKYKLPLPKTPTMVDPFELEGKMRSSGDHKIKLNKKGDKIDARTSAFDEILSVITQGQASGVPKRLPHDDAIDTGKNFILPKGKDRYKNRTIQKKIFESPDPVIKNSDGTYTFLGDKSVESDLLREFIEPAFTSKDPAMINRRVHAEVGSDNEPIPGASQEFYDTFFPTAAAEPRETATVAKSGFDQFKDLIDTGHVAMPEYPSRGAEQTGAGLLAMPGETVYGTTGLVLKGSELAADYINSKTSVVKPTENADFGSSYYFGKTQGVTRAAEATVNAEPIKDVGDMFFRNIGASVPFGAAPLVAVTNTVIGTAIGDIFYDLSDPKYESLPDMLARRPSSKKPELQPYAEVGMVDGDQEISSAYQVLGNWPWIVIGAAATFGGLRAIRNAYKVPVPRITRIDPALQPPRAGTVPADFTPDTEIRSATKPGVAVRTMQQDANAIIKDYYQRAGGTRADDAATLSYFDDLDINSHVNGQNVAASTVRTGTFRSALGRAIEGPSPYVLREAHRKMTPLQQETYNQGMVAADKIDDLNNGKSAYTVGMTMEHAQAVVAQMRRDPILAAMEKDYRKITENLLRFEADGGLIDPIFAQSISRSRPGFMPNISVDKDIDQSIWKTMGDAIWANPTREADDLRLLPTLHRRDEELGVRNYLPANDALMLQVQHMVQFVNQNRLRRKLLTDMMHSSDKTIAGSVRQIIPGRNTPFPVQEDRVTGYYSNGEKIKFEVADPMLAKSMDLAPNAAIFPVFNAFRKYTQFWQTAISPMFAPKVFLRESLQSGVFRPPERKFGYVDSAFKYASGGRIGYRGDMTGMIGAMFNIPKDLVPRAALNLSQHIESTLLSGNKPFWGQLDNIFGPGSTKAVADRMRNSYVSSMRGVLDTMGGYNVKMTQYGIGQAVSELEKFGSAWENKFGTSSISAYNAYKAAIESLHNAPRLFFFSQNFKPGMSMNQLNRLAVQTQNLTGDLRKSGLGKSGSKLKEAESNNEAIRRAMTNMVNQKAGAALIRGGIESSLYANPTIQGLAKIGTTLKNDPTGFGMGLFNLMAVPSVATLVMGAYLDHKGEEGYLDYLFNRRPEWKKVSSIPVFIPGVPPENSPEIEIDPTLGVFLTTLNAVVDQIVTSRDWNPQLEGSGLEFPAPNEMIRRAPIDEAGLQVWNSIGALVGMQLPVPISLYLVANGYDTFNTGGPGYGTMYQQKEEGLTGAGGMTEKREPDNVLPMWSQSLIQEAHGSIGAILTGLLDAGVAGYEDDGVETAMEAIKIQSQMEAIRYFRFANVVPFHNEYASRESPIKYEKQRAADNLAKVILAQFNHPGEIRSKPLAGEEGIISDDAMSGMNTFAANPVILQPVKNEAFAEIAPLLYDKIAKGPTKHIIDILSTVNKQQKALKAVNAGNLHLFKDNIKSEHGTLGSLKGIQRRINELEIIKRKLNIRYIELMADVEKEFGFKLEDIDPFKEVRLPPQVPQGDVGR